MSSNFDNYLSTHFASLGGKRRNVRRLESLRANYTAVLPKDRTSAVLDVGPGTGEMLQLLIEQGFTNVGAIDLSAEVSDYCSRKFCPTLHVDDPVEFLNLHASSYDLITLLHVLEHVEKHQIIPFLRAIHGALKPGGQVVIEVPNMGNPLVGLTYRYADFTHEVGFTGSSLAQVLRIAGFSDPRVRPFRIPLTSFARLAQYSLRKLTEGIMRMLTALYTSDIELNSANLVAIARRST